MLRRHVINSSNQRVIARCHRSAGDQQVINGLAMTPSQMQELAVQGVPINNQTLAAYYDDGYSSLSFEMPLDLQRGIDVAQLWEEKQRIGKKVVKAHKAEVDFYGPTNGKEGE